jgi:hypothetical protein
MMFRGLILKIIFIAWIIVFGNIPTIKAEPYLRVCKNGVVYYYFAQKETKQTSLQLKKFPIASNRVQSKLSFQELEPLIREAAKKHDLPPPLVKAIIRVESNFYPQATSPKGAQGLMQLMPATANHLQVANPYDIRENIWGGTRYLGMLLQRFNYRLHLALAAYNAGPERVERCQDVPAIKETQDFVRDVCTNFLKYSGEKPSGR